MKYTSISIPILILACSLNGCSRSSDSGVVAASSKEPQGTITARESTAKRQDSYADVVSRVSPAVVTIRSERRVRAAQQYPFGGDPLFREFFGRGNPQAPEDGQSGIRRGLGSGVIVRSDGYCLTNHHVVDGAQEIRVEFGDGRILSAKLVGSDPPSDLALLKVEASDLPVLPLGNSELVRVGDIVLAVGNPLGVGQTVTMGIISAKGRTTGLSDGSFEDFLQTDAPINQGNSGGALVNTTGELIGINSQILSTSGGNIGIGFAIPSNMAKNVLDQLAATGKVRRAHLGVGIQRLTTELAAGLGLKEARGVLVNSVTAGSPAERAGIKMGDAIVAFNGTPVESGNSFRNSIAGSVVGSEVSFTVLRNGKVQKLTAKLDEFKSDQASVNSQNEAPGNGDGELGISVLPVTPEIASRLKLPAGTRGLVVGEVSPTGPAAEAGIVQGDVILELNRQPVGSAPEVKAALQREGSSALLLVSRNGRNLYLTANLHK